MHLSKADQINYDAITSSRELSDDIRNMQLEVYKQKLGIQPGAIFADGVGYPQIAAGLGLLRANKQINAEANTILC